ncbi:MAG: histidine kinase [Blastocatellia bacterium]|nr:histidine kinase [Blastocatellia bacterium]
MRQIPVQKLSPQSSVLGPDMVRLPPVLYWLFLVVGCLFGVDGKCLAQANLSEVVQPPVQYTVGRWGTEDGLPQVSVTSIAQTPDGYLWVGTLGGLARFDGVRFQVFDGKDGLSNIRVVELQVDRQGRLWVRSEGGTVTLYQDQRFTALTTNEGIPLKGVAPLLQGPDGRMWLPAAEGLYCFQDNRLQYLTPAAGQLKTPFIGAVAGLTGNIWVFSNQELFSFENGQFRQISFPTEFATGAISAVLPVAEGRLWVAKGNQVVSGMGATWTRLLPPLGNQNLSFKRVGKVVWIGGEGTLIRLDEQGRVQDEQKTQGFVGTLQHTLIDRNGVFWFSSIFPPTGLYRIQNGIQHIPLESLGIPDESTQALFEDREGSLWLGMTRAGLCRLRPKRAVVLTRDQGLGGNNLYAMLQDRSGGMWIGSHDVNCLTHLAGPNSERFRLKDSVWALCQDRTGKLWVGSPNDGLGWFQAGRVEPYQKLKLPPLLGVVALWEDRQGRLWVGTNGVGLKCLDHDVIRSFSVAEGLAGNHVQHIFESRDGSLWIGTTTGLSHIEGDRVTSFTARAGLGNENVRALFEAADGALWIGTYGGGLTRYFQGRFKVISTREGLFHNTVHCMFEDGRGNLWMNSNGGIFRVSLAELTACAEGKTALVSCFSLSGADGILNPEGNGGCQPAGCQTQDGKIWFPTQQGAVVIDPDMPINPLPPLLAVEQLRFRDHSLVFPNAKTLALPLGERTFEITYTGLSFVNPGRVQFRYQLLGFDQSEQQVGTRRTAYYTNVPPGTYVFRVTACNSDGVWNDQGNTVTVVVPPYFFETRWFFVVCALSGLGIAWGGYRWRVRTFRRRELILSRLVRERTRNLEVSQKETLAALEEIQVLNRQLADANVQLFDENRLERERSLLARAEMQQAQLQMLRYQINPHFLFNALNTIFGLIGLEPKNARLMVRELADFLRYSLHSPQTGMVTLKEEIASIRHFLQIQHIRFGDRLVTGFDIAPEVETCQVPVFLLQPVVENAMKYGMQTDAPVQIRIIARRHRGTLFLRVANTGTWVTPHPAGARPEGMGIGLQNVRERLGRLFGPKAALRSRAVFGWVVIQIRMEQPEEDGAS